MSAMNAERHIKKFQSNVIVDGISQNMKSSEMIHHSANFSSPMVSSAQSWERFLTEQKVQIISVASMCECYAKQVINDNNGEMSCF
jgi:hypothetical protein